MPFAMKIQTLALFLVFLMLGACAKKPPQPAAPAPSALTIADVREFPQDLEVYAREVGAGKRLISDAGQSALYSSFLNIYFGPWTMSRTSIPRRDVASVSKSARGYKYGGKPWSPAEWQAILSNMRISSFPSTSHAAITVRQTDLREVPTHEARFTKPTPKPELDPFDYLQYSSLAPGTPLLIAHTSQDGKWHYVECPIAGGWVDAADIALVDSAFKSLWRTGSHAALIRDNVTLPGAGPNGKDAMAGIGTILPLVSHSRSGLQALIPVKEKNGYAGSAEITLASADAAIMPYPLTPANVARVGNAMMGQAYGWGGMLGLRDCSAMIRDLFAPFGLWLPRNSAAQAKRGNVIRLDGMSSADKAATILRDGKPFLSLVGMPGHITLYVGPWKNRPAIFHNAWGLRIVKDGSDDERFVIGKAVVTSITPGMELENLYRPKTFVDRIRTLTRLGSR